MDESQVSNQQALSAHSEPRKHQNKPTRVAFGRQLERHIPPRDESPTRSLAHHRSFSTVEKNQPVLSRLSSSSTGESAIVSKNSSQSPTDNGSETDRPKPTLKRAKSDSGQALGAGKPVADDEEDFAMRHGWQEEYTSTEYLKILHSVRMS